MSVVNEYVDYLESPELWVPRRVVPNDTDLDLDNDVFSPSMYHTFEIPKNPEDPSAGTRTVTAPNERLKRAQYRILESLIACHPTGSSVAHAYYKGRSIKTMAEPHIGKRVVVKLDISNFFPSITPAQVRTVLRRQNIPAVTMNRVNRWCFYEGGLPVGAPTSPLLSNIVAARYLDRRLLGLTEKWRRGDPATDTFHRYDDIAYTRYADDLVFSSDYRLLPHMIPILKHIINEAGFEVNERKVSIRTNGKRQTVVGIATNRKLSKPRNYRKKLRNQLYLLALDIALGNCPPGMQKQPETGEITPINLQRLHGKIAHIRSVDAGQARSLQERYDLLTDLCSPREQWSLPTQLWVDSRRTADG